MDSYIKFFKNIDNSQVAIVGGKNASLGEMYQKLGSKGVKIPNGFATTANAYWQFLKENNLFDQLQQTLSRLDTTDFSNLHEIGDACRLLFIDSKMPQDLNDEIIQAYQKLMATFKHPVELAVRSSATAEDLPNASFAGQQESYLNVRGEAALISYIKKCYASLFTDRAIKYRFDNGFDHMKVALSACVQHMVRSDLSSAGVGFTLDPETGFRNVIYLTGSWGLGENVVQGAVNTDEFYIYKPNLNTALRPILSKKVGNKAITMIYADSNKEGVSTKNIETSAEKRKQFILNDNEIIQLANWCKVIEDHYGRPMDIEWAKDGISGELFIVQARPETVHSQKQKQTVVTEYQLQQKPAVITQGVSVGDRIAYGVARVLSSPLESDKLQKGEILVTGITSPDWDPMLKKAAAIITDKGGRTSHAAIVAREAGAIAVVGTVDATSKIKDGQLITVSCAEGSTGVVYDGKAEWTETITDLSHLADPQTSTMFILGDPEKAFELSLLPNNGVGLMRLEFVINNAIKIHPMALVKFNDLTDQKLKDQINEITYGYADKKQFFVEELAQAVGTIAAAFYPKDVIVRMSDFKSNEYANLVGGAGFEPTEENPMIGFRGASRYYNERYKDGFKLECEAMKVVRNEMGFDNVKLMIPFCRTVEEGKKVIQLMKDYGLIQGENKLEIYVMCEIPSNVILADEFAEVFDGFSIGSNDLTQLTLGIDRDSSIISGLFDENNEAIKMSIQNVIQKVKAKHKKIGICGQGPSDSPEFAKFLVELEIDSISFNPDAYLKGLQNVLQAEAVLPIAVTQ